MSKFSPLTKYQEAEKAGYRLLPFNFSALSGDDYVTTNAVGEFVVLRRGDLHDLIRHKLSNDSPVYRTLKSKHFIIDGDSDVAVDLLALKTRTKLLNLANFTGLHIFVVSLRCEHSCPYCQVSRQSDDRLAYDMSEETAERALDLVFRSPGKLIKIEFQGGEPLLNFERIRHVVLRAKQRNEAEKRDLEFVIATNLALLDDAVLSFCKEHNILISTSLDGPADLHNKNRPRPGRNSHQLAVEGIRRAQLALGHDRVGALMTTTEASLPRVREIVDEYVRLGLNSIFLRPLSPYGFAIKTKSFASYGQARWLEFFKDGLNYILELNRAGQPMVEQYTATVLTKMLTPWNPGYLDLRSPSGIGIGVLVYNYDGDLYASDEGRMLAEMGDKKFRLGNIHTDTYEDMLLSDVLLDAIEDSFSGSAPMCADCAFEPYCGSEPVYHYATQGDYVGKKPLSDFCNRNMAIFRHIIELTRSDPEARAVFHRWALH